MLGRWEVDIVVGADIDLCDVVARVDYIGRATILVMVDP